MMKILLPRLHRAQLEVQRHPARFKVISAGRRWGKDILEVSECFRRAIKGQFCWHVCPSYQSADFQRAWAIGKRLASQIPGVIEHQQKKWFDFSAIGGAWMQFKTAEEPDGLRGEGLHFVAIQEAGHTPNFQEMWEQALRSTLMDYRGEAWFMGTPKGFNYFYELSKRSENDNDWASFQFDTGSNPYIDKGEIESMRRSLPALVARQEIDAEFVQLAGALFKRENVTLIDAPPAGLQWVRSWDLAFTEKTTSDYTAGAKVAMDGDGRIIVGHVVHLRAEWPQVVRTIADTARMDGSAVQQGIECVGAQVGALQTLLRDPMLVNHTLRPIEVTKDKLTRALPLVARSEQSKFAVVRGAWTQAFLDELCAFPESPHDDQVDAVTGALTMLENGNRYFIAVV